MTTNTQDPDLRDRAVTSLRKKREFLSHLVLYLTVVPWVGRVREASFGVEDPAGDGAPRRAVIYATAAGMFWFRWKRFVGS